MVIFENCDLSPVGNSCIHVQYPIGWLQWNKLGPEQVIYPQRWYKHIILNAAIFSRHFSLQTTRNI